MAAPAPAPEPAAAPAAAAVAPAPAAAADAKDKANGKEQEKDEYGLPPLPPPHPDTKSVSAATTKAATDAQGPAPVVPGGLAYQIDGVWDVDHAKSDDFEPFLKLQGMSWLVRKLAKGASASIALKLFEKDGKMMYESTLKSVVFTSTVVLEVDADYKLFTHPMAGSVRQRCWVDRATGMFRTSQVRGDAPFLRTEQWFRQRDVAVVDPKNPQNPPKQHKQLLVRMDVYDETDGKLKMLLRRVLNYSSAPK